MTNYGPLAHLTAKNIPVERRECYEKKNVRPNVLSKGEPQTASVVH